MTEYLRPGVYLEELDFGTDPTRSAGPVLLGNRATTAPVRRVRSTWTYPHPVAGFVGFAPSGPADKPVLILNWSHYVQTFGAFGDYGSRNPHLPGAYLSHAVFGYFLNGGERCYVVRLAPNSDRAGPSRGAPIPSRGSSAVPSFTIRARSDDSDDLYVKIQPPSDGDAEPDSFSVYVRSGSVEELYENVTLGRRVARNVADLVNANSRLVIVVEEATSGSMPERLPKLGDYLIPHRLPPWTVGLHDLAGDFERRSGLEGLASVEDITMVCCPDLMAAYQDGAIDRDGVKAIQLQMIAHSERSGDRMAILDPPPGLSPREVREWRMEGTYYDSKYAALYYPWVQVADPDGRPMDIPPSGHVAGLWCRSDLLRGVRKSPANEILRGVLSPSLYVSKGEHDVLNPIGVNVIRHSPGNGVRVWGARTLSSDPAFRYIYRRRVLSFVETIIERGTQWVVFESASDKSVWVQIEHDLGDLLTLLWRAGVLQGGSAREAYFVRCDSELNLPETQAIGRIYAHVGIALDSADVLWNLRVVYFVG